MDVITLLKTLAIVCFVLAGLMLVLAIVFFFVFKIPAVIGNLSGRTAKKAIEQLKEETGESGNLYKSGSRTKPHKFMSLSGNLKSQPVAPEGNTESPEGGEFHASGGASLYDDMPGRTGNFSTMTNPYAAGTSQDGNGATANIGGYAAGEGETSVIGGNETTVLGGNETTVLGGAETSVLGGNETTVLGGGETSVLGVRETSGSEVGGANVPSGSAGETSVLGIGPQSANIMGNVSETSVLTADMYPNGYRQMRENLPVFRIEFEIGYTDSKEIIA